METLYVSQAKLDEMKAELHHMKSVQRHEIANHIERAKELGDLRENADYQQAKEDLAMLETKIIEFNDAILRAKVIEKTDTDKAQIGSTVTIKAGETGTPRTYTIVGGRESNPQAGHISNESPLGQAILGRKVGEQFEFKAPAGVIVYTVISIS